MHNLLRIKADQQQQWKIVLLPRGNGICANIYENYTLAMTIELGKVTRQASGMSFVTDEMRSPFRHNNKNGIQSPVMPKILRKKYAENGDSFDSSLSTDDQQK